MDRLFRSLNELQMRAPASRAALGLIMREIVRRNRIVSGAIYLQVTRGVAKRDFQFPDADTRPSLVCYGFSNPRRKAEDRAARGIAVVTMPDMRWKRVDIKTIGLLPNALVRQGAIDRGAQEGWMVDSGGLITEGASCNAWIVTKDGELVTRPAETGILRGITRTVVMDLIRGQGLSLSERAFTPDEARNAAEAFNTSATGLVMPVVSIDGTTIGDGKPGPFSRKIRMAFHDFAEKSDMRSLPPPD